MESNKLPSEEQLEKMLAEIRYSPAPSRLKSNIMDSICPAQEGLWRRLQKWLFTPRPIQIAPVWQLSGALALVLMILLAGVYNPFRFAGDQPNMAQNPSTQNFGPVQVVFKIDADQAHQVALIGSFNNWQKYELSKSSPDGPWTITLPLENGRYKYAFVVDGKQVVADPRALLQEDDGFGNLNSVLIVEDNEQTEQYDL